MSFLSRDFLCAWIKNVSFKRNTASLGTKVESGVSTLFTGSNQVKENIFCSDTFILVRIT